MTGRPARVGSSNTSTEAKNASMSTCRITRLCSSTEAQPPEALGERNPGAPAGVFRGPAYRGGRPLGAVGELAPVAAHCPHLHLDRVGDVHPHVGLEGAGQQDGGDLM